jgi:hypothetical protein
LAAASGSSFEIRGTDIGEGEADRPSSVKFEIKIVIFLKAIIVP